MCDFIIYYYVRRNCRLPEAHAQFASRGGGSMKPCSSGPHKRFLYEPGECALCMGRML
ncbi:hypothetical protein FN846DRAFT_932089 [Sphaerosporella brunnea]|uniref:Uncharacterized protein n=1 Tax=Sphaerosporella brunnea TaxID=1250544 RepID=A0A5J5F7F9_9PEZI|nr:hypothetical protein FN846DRAFT_932089 [Sphaerosporella brunnea]